jgi:hypothetical protein
MSQIKTIKYPSGVVLVRTFDNENEEWVVDNKALSVATFTLDLSGCENVNIVGEGDSLQKTLVLNPQQKGSIKVQKVVPWSFSAKFSLSEEPVSYEEQQKMADKNKGNWDEMIEKSAEIFKSIPYEVLTHDEMVSRMNQIG